MKTSDKIGMLLGSVFPHIDKMIQQEWWKDWAHPLILSLLGAIIGLLVMHYGKKMLNDFDNWRNIQKLNRKR